MYGRKAKRTYVKRRRQGMCQSMCQSTCQSTGRWEDGMLAAGMLIFAALVTAVTLTLQGSVFSREDEEGETAYLWEKVENAPERTKDGKGGNGEMPEKIEVTSRKPDPRSAKNMIYGGTVKKLEQPGEDAGPLIVLDPGHGGVDDGCVQTGVKEKSINLRIALLTKKKLEEKGYQVLLTREKDDYVSKEERAEFANQMGADAFISIHQNTFEDAEVYGLETWYDETGGKRESERLARLIHGQTLASTGTLEREIRGDANFHVTSNTQMAACLIETGFLSNREERGSLTDSEYQEKAAEGIAQGIDLFFHPKAMYLTFDDGPSAECTDMVLNILRERNVKATFFLIGEYVEKYPEVAKRIAQEGHTIGIHCYRHDYGELYKSVDSYLEDFQKAYDVIEEATGVKPKLFRFPGGSVNAYNKSICKDIIREMTGRGYVYFDWNASLEDAAGATEPEELLANAKATAMDRKRVVLLAHDRVYNTALCLDRLLTQFPEYKMEVLDVDVEPVKFALP